MPHPRCCTPLPSRVAALLAAGILSATPCSAASVLVRWTIPPEPDVAGYYLYVGRTSGDYLERTQLASREGSALNGIFYHLLPDLQLATDYYLAVTAYNSGGIESPYSNERHILLGTDAAPTADAGPDVIGVPGQVIEVGTAALPGITYFWSQTAGAEAMLWGRTSGRMELQGHQADTLEFTVTAYTTQGLAARDSVVVVLAEPTVAPSRTPVTPVSTPTLVPSQTPSASRTASATPTSTPIPSATPPASSTPVLLPTSSPTSRIERSNVGRVAAIRQHPNCRVTTTTDSSSRRCPD